MTDKELKKLSRVQLLEMLLMQSKKVEELEKEIDELKDSLDDRNLKIKELGSVAEASLILNGVFEAAQKAADQYLESTKYRCRTMEEETKRRCLELLDLAEKKSNFKI